MEKVQKKQEKALLCTLSSLPSLGASLVFFQRIFVRTPQAGYFIVLAYLMYGFRAYLSKKSKYYDDDVPLCPWNHYLIWTSGIYLVGAIVAFLYGQHHFSVLCFITWIGSSSYHRYKEAKFFNLDNIFATSLLVIFVWSMCLSYTFSSFYFYFGVLGIPVAGFLLIYCGMPADIVSVYRGTMCCYIREDRPIYMVVHACWHIASGTGKKREKNYESSYLADQQSSYHTDKKEKRTIHNITYPYPNLASHCILPFVGVQDHWL